MPRSVVVLAHAEFILHIFPVSLSPQMPARLLDTSRKVIGLGVGFLAATTLTNPKACPFGRDVLINNSQAMKRLTNHANLMLNDAASGARRALS